jgi:carbamoyl-phosphate synthase large subunit
MGIDFDFGRAFFKASLAADNTLPLQGCIFISVNDDQKEVSIPIARKLQDLGLELYGTSGTVQHLAQAGIRMNLVRKVQEGSPNVIDMMRRGEIQLIINTPSDKSSRQDHYQIMRIAVDYGIPYITTIPAADAAAMAIEAYKKNETTIEPLGFYLR